MSGLSDLKQASAGVENRGGLPLEQFISTLEWACDSHGSPQSHEVPSNCVVCRRQLSNSASDSDATGDHLDGFAVFQVTRLHRLSFSPLGDSTAPLSRIRATLSVFDGLLRVALYLTSSKSKCLTLDIEKILEEPTVESTDKMLCLLLMFPFVSLSFERVREISEGARDAAEESHVGDLQFSAMRDAVVQIWSAHLRAHRSCRSENVGAKEGTFVSLFENKLKQKKDEIDVDRADLRDGLLNFSVHGSAMVMPLGFPYKPPHSEFEGLNVDQSKQMLFYDAFLSQEVIVRAATEQAIAWVRRFARAHKATQDVLVNKNKAGERQNQLLLHDENET